MPWQCLYRLPDPQGQSSLPATSLCRGLCACRLRFGSFKRGQIRLDLFCVGVIRAERIFKDGERALQKRPSEIILPLVAIECSEVVAGVADQVLIRPECLLPDGERALKQRFGEIVVSLGPINLGEAIANIADMWVVAAERLFADRERTLQKRLGEIVFPLGVIKLREVVQRLRDIGVIWPERRFSYSERADTAVRRDRIALGRDRDRRGCLARSRHWGDRDRAPFPDGERALQKRLGIRVGGMVVELATGSSEHICQTLRDAVVGEVRCYARMRKEAFIGAPMLEIVSGIGGVYRLHGGFDPGGGRRGGFGFLRRLAEELRKKAPLRWRRWMPQGVAGGGLHYPDFADLIDCDRLTL